MDFGMSSVPDDIASSTTGYMVQFKGVFLLVAGLVLAYIVILLLLRVIWPSRYSGSDFDDDDPGAILN